MLLKELKRQFLNKDKLFEKFNTYKKTSHSTHPPAEHFNVQMAELARSMQKKGMIKSKQENNSASCALIQKNGPNS